MAEGSGTADRWPAWFAFAGFAMAFGAALLAATVVTTVDLLAGGEAGQPSPWAVTGGVVLQDVALVLVAVGLARSRGRPTLADFGLTAAPPRRTVGFVALAWVVFYGFSAGYGALVEPEGQQQVLETLGADRSTMSLVGAGFVLVVLAPIAEEFFFRGFFYRALRNRLSVSTAATTVGVVFGLIHFTGAATLSLLPILALLGVTFCLLYEFTGTLYAPIALHAINNALALALTSQTSAAPTVAAALGALALTACAIGMTWNSRAEQRQAG